MIVEELKTSSSAKTSTAFHRILVPVDFSDPSRHALAFAVPFASVDAQVCAVHVMNSDWRYEMLENPPEIDREKHDALQQLQSLVAEIDSKRKIGRILLRHGPTVDAILALAAEDGSDLLVVGTRGYGGLQKLALGSVAEELLRVAPIPVMTLGPHAHAAVHGPVKLETILFATDFGKGSTRALPLVLNLAAEHQARLAVLHMISPMPATSNSLSSYAPATSAADELQAWEATSRKRSLQQIKEWLPRETGLKHEPIFIVGTDFLPEGVLDAAARFKADLIVMGANHSNAPRFAAHIPGTAVHEVIRHAPCPVLTVAG